MLHDQCIIRDLDNPTALFISFNIYLRVFSRTNILKCKIKSAHYTRSLKDLRILALYNSTCSLAYRSVIDYDLNDILSPNLSDAIFKLFRNVILVFHFSLGIYGVQKHQAIFGDRREINDRSFLRIRPSLTTNRDPLLLPCAPVGLHQPLYVRFLTL